jgi:hypothetical protein
VGFIEKVNSDRSLLPLPLKIEKAYQYYDWHWSFNFIVAGLFIGMGVVIYFHGKVLFQSKHVLFIFLFTAVLVSLLRGFFFKKGIYYLRHLMLFSFAGVAPLMFSLLLVTNYYIKTSYSRYVYRVSGYEVISKYEKGYPHRYYLLELEGGAFSGFRDIRSVPASNISMKDFDKTVYFWVTISNGILGVPNYEESGIALYQSQPAKSESK